MGWEPRLGAFCGAAAFIVFVDCMYFLSILLQLQRHPERRFELKEQPEKIGKAWLDAHLFVRRI